MYALRAIDAFYAVRGERIVAPASFDVAPQARHAITCESARAARALAMMAAALVRATSGSILIGEFDPRVQPAHCKARAAFVPHDPLPVADLNVERFVAYRAALWNLDLSLARARAQILLEKLDGIHESFAYPIVGALLASPALLVLDRPHAAFASQILEAAGACAVFSTHVDEATARLFSLSREKAPL